MSKTGFKLAWTLPLLLAVSRVSAGPDAVESSSQFCAAALAFDNGHYDEAINQWLDLLTRYPRHLRLQMLLADAYERSGRPAPALKLCRAALAGELTGPEAAVLREQLARLEARLKNDSPTGDDRSKDFPLTPQQIAAFSVTYPQPSRRRTEHFDIVAYNQGLADLLADRVEPMLERVRRAVLGAQLYPHRIELTVYPDEAAFGQSQGPPDRNTLPDWSGGAFQLARLPDGSVRRAVLLYQVDAENRFRTSLLDRELPHELAHVMLHEYFGQTACPLWLDEGLASTAETDNGQALAARMRELLALDAQTPLASMIDQAAPALDKSNALNFYVQAASLTRFLRQQLDDEQLKTVLAQIKDGQKPSVALGRALVLDDRRGWLAALELRWHDSVRRRRD